MRPESPEVLEFEWRRRQELAAWIEHTTKRHGPTLDFEILKQGFLFEGRRHPVMHRQKGIYQPKDSPFALTLKRSVRGPYDDRFTDDGALRYAMERSGPAGDDNRAVIASCRRHLPLLFLDQVARAPTARFTAFYPVWIVDVDLERAEFGVDLERPPAAAQLTAGAVPGLSITTNDVRRYAERHLRVRMHQTRFRERVLDAYQTSCAMCRLREAALLDAAHIDADASDEGEPVVSNGLALCKLHHAAFDAHFVAIEPESHRIRVQPRLLREHDGPVLRHGIQELEGTALRLPAREADQPDRLRLQRRWAQFEHASA
jgi:putative restriction endonuclease